MRNCEGNHQFTSIASSFHALTSPTGRRRRARTGERVPSPPPLRSYEVLPRDVAATSVGERTSGTRYLETTFEDHAQEAASVVSAHSSYRSSSSDVLQQQAVVPIQCNADTSDIEGRRVGNSTTTLPSHYYVDASGQMRIKKVWWCYTRMRRVLWCVFPWLKKDSNTFLSAQLVANSTLIIAVHFVRILFNIIVIPKILSHRVITADDGEEKQCLEHSLKFLDMYTYSLLASMLLCLPALNFKACRLYQPLPRYSSTDTSASSSTSSRDSTAADVDGEQQRVEKTYFFTLCELVVVANMIYLLFVLVVVFVPSNGSIFELFETCDSQLNTGFFILLILVEVVAVYAYILRWRQILLFHRLHQHLLFQRGFVPGHSRFDYVEKSFATPLYAWLPAPLWACWRRCERLRNAVCCRCGSLEGNQGDEALIGSRSKKQHIQAVKVALYSAAKRGHVEHVRTLLESAVKLSGPDFATEWYEPRVWNFANIFLLARGQRNPLHVAIAFDQIEVVQELLANGHFDVQQLDKLELLRLDCAWLYRFMFRALFFVLRRSSAGVVANASSGGGTGNSGAAPGLASASQPFGPVGLFQTTLLTPLHVAVTLGHAELTLLLLRYGAKPDALAISTHPRFATPPLYWAVNKECTRLLLDAGGNPLALPKGASGLLLTAFEVARIAGNAVVARQMEKYGGDVALTPLHDACAGGRHQEVAFFLEHGADPDTLGEQVSGCFRRTPLHWAAMRGHAGIIQLLVQYGANVNARDVFKRTPLAWACVLNRTRAVDVLLKSNADVNMRDAQGDPLLCICAAGACGSIQRNAKTVADENGKLGDDRMQEDECDDDEDGGLGVTLNGQKVLARGLDPRIFQLLLDHGVDLHATRTSNGDSALHVALRHRNQTAAVLFVRAGLSLTAANLFGQRAIDCAQSSSLRFAVKKEAGQRDVMISYSHAHASLARELRDALESQRVTTWIDTMGPTGITGGAVWRQEIARGIQSSALVLAVLTKDYPQSQWCMKELAFAKMQNIPVVAIQCEDMEISEELQVYLWTRQVIDFRPAFKQYYAVKKTHSDTMSPSLSTGRKGDISEGEDRLINRNSSHTAGDTESFEDEGGVWSEVEDPVNEADGRELAPDDNSKVFRHCLRMLLDGIQDQIEEHRARLARRQARQQQTVVPGHEMDDRAGEDASRLENLCNVSESYVGEDKSLSELFSVCGTASDCGSADTSKIAERPLPVPHSRPRQKIESLASSLAPTPTGSFVFIAHGDFHRSFCLHLQKAMLKQGIRCVVDQTVPAVHYAHGYHEHVGTDFTHFSGSDQSAACLPVHSRQLAAKDAIIACSAVLVVLSPLTASCDLLADQLAFAEDRGKLLVPVLLSLDKVDLAKRYTFSRSMVHHFNVSLGYEQSVEQLLNHLRVQQVKEARQRRLQRRRQEEKSDVSASIINRAGSFSRSFAQRTSSLDSFTEVMELQSPYEDDSLSTDASLLPPTLPVKIIMTRARRGSVSSGAGSSVHGWSDGDVLKAADSFRRDNACSRSGASLTSAKSSESR